jgi:hypothetical protein
LNSRSIRSTVRGRTWGRIRRWRRYQADYTEEACVAGYIELFERLLAERAGGERAEAI